jgi:hypothetical protein
VETWSGVERPLESQIDLDVYFGIGGSSPGCEGRRAGLAGGDATGEEIDGGGCLSVYMAM